jgi:hypothetical protein
LKSRAAPADTRLGEQGVGMSIDRAAILVVAATEAEGRSIAGTMGLDSVALIATPEDAGTYIESSRLAGMVVGHSCRSAVSKPLVRSYARHQPCGRVAVLARPDDLTKVTAFAFKDERVELFFVPWRAHELLGYLHVETEAATTR